MIKNNYPRAQATKEKTEKYNYIKIKTHVHQKTIDRIEKATHKMRGNIRLSFIW